MATDDEAVVAEWAHGRDGQTSTVSSAPSTEVWLDHRTNRRYRLVFGAPFEVLAMDHSRAVTARRATFRPGDRFGVALWEANDFGTTQWRVLVCRALREGETGVRVPQVRPGAQVLLDIAGATRVRAALRWLSPYAESGEALTLPDERFIEAGFRLANTPLARLKSYAAGRV